MASEKTGNKRQLTSSLPKHRARLKLIVAGRFTEDYKTLNFRFMKDEQPNSKPNRLAVLSRQFVVITLISCLFGLIVTVLYLHDRSREWRFRGEQCRHRLELAYELISRDLERVRSDVLYIANQQSIKKFAEQQSSRDIIQSEFSSFLSLKQRYVQIRLLDLFGQEIVRVDNTDRGVTVIAQDRLQNKHDRYYFVESLGLNPGEVFVSEFDLNQEFGAIEEPLLPVVRFVTPVTDESGTTQYLLIINYLGRSLLKELSSISLPGYTLLVRYDGEYLLGPSAEDAWGWLIGHRRTFASQFATAWNRASTSAQSAVLTESGGFAFRPIELQKLVSLHLDHSNQRVFSAGRELWIVSYLPQDQVFASSRQLLERLVILGGIMMIPLIILTRFWAFASVRRQVQGDQIRMSERKLRELSARLLRIQEEERRTISREIHDQLGQQVTAINLDLKLAERESIPPEAREHLHRAIEENEQLLGSLHDFATRVRPLLLDDFGLQDAIEQHLSDFQIRTGLHVELTSDIAGLSLPAVVNENVFRLIQEALNNVLKHAEATGVQVNLSSLTTETGVQLHLQIIDDGKGASALAEQLEVSGNPRLGILGMRERVELLGGELVIMSGEDQGTRIVVIVPLGDLTTTDLGDVNQ